MSPKISFRILSLFLFAGLSTAAFVQTVTPTPTPTPNAVGQVVAQSTFLSYQTVRDNFGKKFADQYFVVQIDIRNENLDQQFIVQKLDVIIDPNQCSNGKVLYADFDTNTCKSIFDKHFLFPNAMQSVRREELLGVGKAAQDRSPINIFFRSLAFTANVGSILTGFNGLIGRDGIRAINVLGTTFTESAGLFFPNRTVEKFNNLRDSIPTEDVIIKSKESKTFNMFIPTDRIFYKDSWKEYKRSVSKSQKATLQLKAVLDLILLSSASGVLVNNNAPVVTVRSDDQLRQQNEKFSLVRTPSDQEKARNAEFLSVIQDLSKQLSSGNEAAVTQATNILRKIKSRLDKTHRFRIFLTGAGLTDTSSGMLIRDVLIRLSKNLESENEDPTIVAAFEKAVIAKENE